MKKILFALLLVPVLFSACKKDDSNNVTAPAIKNEFVINGIHDLNLDGTPLNLSINQVSGIPESVTISVSGLPSGITASINKISGTPTFTTAIDFSTDYTTPAGSYPIKITGTSASGTKSYDLNIIVSQANFFMLGTSNFQITNTSVSNGYIMVIGQGNYVLSIQTGDGQLPTATKTYRIVGTATASDELDFSIASMNGTVYSCKGDDQKTAIITVRNGKIGVVFSNVKVYNVNSSTDITTASAAFSQ